MLTYELEKTSTEPIYIQIYRHIRMDIEQGRIEAGEKLPSKRALAANLGVSIITVENAYSQLVAEGYVRSIPKKGYFTENIQIAPAKPTESVCQPSAPSEVKTENTPPLFPFTVWAKLMREELACNRAKLLTRPPAEGVYELREAIAGHLKSFRNMDVLPEQIIIGAGTEYLYILIRMLLGEKSVIAVEDPGYGKIADIYESLGMRCEWIPMCSDGIDTELLKKSHADVAHISPSHHFPTGVLTSIGKRYELLSWAAKGRYIIEDDYDSEIRISCRPIPSLFSIDVTDRVIYMNTFSKSLTPTIRISYMILPLPLLERFREKLGSFSCAVSAFEQYTLARFISDGYFEKHIRRLRKYCKDGRDAILKCVSEGGLFENAVISGNNAGLHCLVQFDTKITDTELLSAVTEMGFRASALRDYYRTTPEQELHSLIIYYY